MGVRGSGEWLGVEMGDPVRGGGKKIYKIRRVFKKSLKPKQKATQIFT